MATSTATTTIHSGVIPSPTTPLMGQPPKRQSILHVDRISRLQEKRSKLHRLRTMYNSINSATADPPSSVSASSRHSSSQTQTPMEAPSNHHQHQERTPTVTMGPQHEALTSQGARAATTTKSKSPSTSNRLVEDTTQTQTDTRATAESSAPSSPRSGRKLDSKKLEEYKRLSGLKKKRLQELKEESSHLVSTSNTYGAGLDFGRVSASFQAQEPAISSPPTAQDAVIGTSVVIHAKSSTKQSADEEDVRVLETSLSSDDDFSSLSGILDHSSPQHHHRHSWMKPHHSPTLRRPPNIFEDVNEDRRSMEQKGIPSVISFEALPEEQPELPKEQVQQPMTRTNVLSEAVLRASGGSPLAKQRGEGSSARTNPPGGSPLAKSRCLLYYGDKVDVLESDIERLEIEKAELLGIVQNLRETVATCEYKVATLEVEKARLRDINEITYSGMKQLLVEQNIESEKLRSQVEALEQTVEHTSVMNRIGFGVSSVLILGAAILSARLYYLSDLENEIFDEGRVSGWFV